MHVHSCEGACFGLCFFRYVFAQNGPLKTNGYKLRFIAIARTKPCLRSPTIRGTRPKSVSGPLHYNGAYIWVGSTSTCKRSYNVFGLKLFAICSVVAYIRIRGFPTRLNPAILAKNSPQPSLRSPKVSKKLAYSACTFTRVREPVLDSVFFAMFSLRMAL
jgi:hypothetical protein